MSSHILNIIDQNIEKLKLRLNVASLVVVVNNCGSIWLQNL